MPRVGGVSITSTVWLVHLSPSPRTVARCDSLQLAVLFASVTFNFFASATSRLHDLFDRLAALGSNVGRRVLRRECVDDRAHHVVRVGRSLALREDVRDAYNVEHGAHRTTGDDP